MVISAYLCNPTNVTFELWLITCPTEWTLYNGLPSENNSKKNMNSSHWHDNKTRFTKKWHQLRHKISRQYSSDIKVTVSKTLNMFKMLLCSHITCILACRWQHRCQMDYVHRNVTVVYQQDSSHMLPESSSSIKYKAGKMAS